MSLNDLHPVAELRRRQSALFDAAPKADRPQRIVLYSVDMWQLGIFEQFLHLAFQRKGHEPVSIYYDGLLPVTGWENHWVSPPPLATLAQRAKFVFGCFGIEPVGLSAYVDGSACRTQAEAQVSGLHEQDLCTLHYRGVDVGRVVLRDLFQYTLGHFEPSGPEDVALLRHHLVHALMSVDVAHAILDREQPDIVILVNGKLVMYSYMYEVARSRGVEVTTWEEGMYFDTSVVLAHNDKAIDFPVEPQIWEDYRRRPIDPAELRAVEEYFGRWRDQTATYYRYYDSEVRDFGRIAHELDLPPGKRLVSLFTNIVWDTNALGKDRAFASMMDWVYQTIDFTGSRGDTVLVVRAHPGEYRCQFKTRTPVRELILRRYNGVIPGHVRIVDGPSELSSYEIARHSERCAVYTSTLGIELTFMGLQPLICGRPFYSGRGCTNDIVTAEEYFLFISGAHQPRSAHAEMLKKFMHLVIYRLVKRPEFFVGIHSTPQVPKIRIETFEDFPESMPAFNGIVDAILERRSFIELPLRVEPRRRQQIASRPEGAIT